ncbi:solute carrier family 25 member 51 [Agrilus planipennis]|uniref:Solute carrier family 25 member 51 n=1 Tax=Agrilus planipennis TaxID=224129 RepID=A0A1W4X021_AGRPL|nr:solute carrier family 25 member 51 [Agrilus planipennis]
MLKMSTTKTIPPPGSTIFGWKEFVCGWGAAFINITITYPVNKIIFRQMLHGMKASSAFLQLQNEGIEFLYRGMLPPLCQKTFSVSIMFGVYEETRKPLVNYGTNPYLAKSIAAILAGTAEAILMPFERIQTLLADSAYHHHFRNTFHAFKVVGLEYGVKEYYRGLVPILLRNGPSNVLFFVIREELHERFHDDKRLPRSVINFLSGAAIGIILSALFYPLNVAKITMQSQLGGEFHGLIHAMKHMYQMRGGKIRYLYYGLHTNVMRACLSWGIINSAYETLKKILFNVDF